MNIKEKSIISDRNLSLDQLSSFSGGTVSLGPWYIDDIINGENYKRIVKWLVPEKKEPRTRPVKVVTDIYDVEI